MASSTSAVSSLLLIAALAISISAAAAYHTPLPSGEKPTFTSPSDDSPAPDSFSDDVSGDIPADETIISLVNDAVSPIASAADDLLPSFTISFPDEEASSPYPAVSASAPLSYAPIVDPVDGTVPADEEQKDTLFVEKYLQIAAETTKSFMIEVLEKQIKNAAVDGGDEECADICEQMFLSARHSLNYGLVSIVNKEYFSTDVEVSAFASNVKTCIQCYGDAADPQLLKFENWATGVTDACRGKLTHVKIGL